MDASNTQNSGGEPSTAPTGIDANRKLDRSASIPSLPTPDVGTTSFVDTLLKDPKFSTDYGELVTGPRGEAVKNLADENQNLEQQLQELQKRLDAAEQKRIALEAKRQQASSGAPAGSES